MALFNLVPTFTYPTARDYPVDEVAENIVRALEKRNWDVPGITVDFDIYGSGEKRYMKVATITGEDFIFNFDREQGMLDSLNEDKSALWRVVIADEDIWMYRYGGPNYCLWSGNKEVSYRSDTNKKYFVREKRQRIPFPRLSRTPKKVGYDDVFDRFAKWLKEHVLDYILSYPEAEEIKPAFMPEELIPYSGPWEMLYYIDCTERTAEFILDCQKDIKGLSPEKRYTHIKREPMVNNLLFVLRDDLPSEYFDYYTACEVSRKKAFDDTWPWFYVIVIKPRYANGIYVVDREAFNRLVEKDKCEAELEMMKTMIPLSEYKGEYENPSVLFRREIDFDEIVLVEQKKA